MKNSLVLILTAITLISLNTACSPKVISNPDSNQNPAGNPPKGVLGGEGTSSIGGGGNTINGKPVEAYAKSIDKLPEFKEYIFPILSKLSGQQADVLILYLRWAVYGKPWYFVPVKLDSLSQEQIGLPFDGQSVGQVARNTKSSVYIDENEYQKLSRKDRARLLLHEMVMSARFLMKQKPQVQCQALVQNRDLAVCKDEEAMKSGIDSVVNEADRESLNALEHEQVRLMTNYLMDQKGEIDPEEVKGMRIRYGFHFPWDDMTSKFRTNDFSYVFKRARAAGDRFFQVGPSFLEPESAEGPECHVVFPNDPEYIYNLIGWVDRDAEQKYAGFSSVDNRSGEFWRIQSQHNTWRSGIITSQPYSRILVRAKGIIRKDLSSEVIDHVTVLPLPFEELINNEQTERYILEFFLSRTPKMKILEYKVTPVRAVEVTIAQTSTTEFTFPEYVPIYGKKPLICRHAELMTFDAAATNAGEPDSPTPQ